MSDKSTVIAAVCSAPTDGALDNATSLLKRDYPFAPEPIRQWHKAAKLVLTPA